MIFHVRDKGAGGGGGGGVVREGGSIEGFFFRFVFGFLERALNRVLGFV